mgnify:CR=1 FL=1
MTRKEIYIIAKNDLNCDEITDILVNKLVDKMNVMHEQYANSNWYEDYEDEYRHCAMSLALSNNRHFTKVRHEMDDYTFEITITKIEPFNIN